MSINHTPSSPRHARKLSDDHPRDHRHVRSEHRIHPIDDGKGRDTRNSGMHLRVPSPTPSAVNLSPMHTTRIHGQSSLKSDWRPSANLGHTCKRLLVWLLKKNRILTDALVEGLATHSLRNENSHYITGYIHIVRSWSRTKCYEATRRFPPQTRILLHCTKIARLR